MDTLTPERALAACEAITSFVTTSPNPFGLSTGVLQNLSAVHDGLAADLDAQRRGALDQKARVAAKDASLAAVGQALSAAAKIALASGASDSQLRQIGLARPAKPVRPTSIPAPTGLLASAQSESRAKLAFGRNGTTQGTTYEVFWSPDGLAYQMVASTTKASLIVEQTAGVAAWFKVRAVRAGLVSDFSNAASLYAPSAAKADFAVVEGGRKSA